MITDQLELELFNAWWKRTWTQPATMTPEIIEKPFRDLAMQAWEQAYKNGYSIGYIDGFGK